MSRQRDVTMRRHVIPCTDANYIYMPSLLCHAKRTTIARRVATIVGAKAVMKSLTFERLTMGNWTIHQSFKGISFKRYRRTRTRK